MSVPEVAERAARQREHYIAERVGAGQTRRDAERAAAEQWERYFPGGDIAPGHRHYRLVADGAGGGTVGWLWLGPAPTGASTGAWIYYIEIEETLRGRGYGRAAMLLAEQDARAHGDAELGLNVFGRNTTARKLYESLGFEPTFINMRKRIVSNADEKSPTGA